MNTGQKQVDKDEYMTKVDGYGQIQDKSRWIWMNTGQKQVDMDEYSTEVGG